MLSNNFRLSLVLVLLLCVVSGPAFAEKARWVPVMLESDAAPRPFDALAELGEALAARAPVELIEPAEAAAQYQQAQSQAPVRVQDAVVDQLAQQLKGAIAQASMHHFEQARQFDAAFSALQPREQDDFLIRTGLSRDVFGLCVMAAMPLIDAGHRSAAIDHATTCLQRLPALDVPQQRFSERTRSVLSEAQQRLDEQGLANLHIELDSTTPCTLHVNGSEWRAAGPQRLAAVPVRIQARCQDPSRVHVLALKPGDNQLRIDLRRDSAIGSEGYISLRYTSAEEARRFRQVDAAEIARELGASASLLVEPTPSGDWVLRLVDSAGDSTATQAVVLSDDPSQAEVLGAVDRLVQRLVPSAMQTHEQTVAVDTPGAEYGLPQADDSGFLPSLVDVGAVAVGVAGLAGLVASWTYYDLRRQYREAVASGDDIYQPQYIAQGKNAMLLNVSGAVLLSASAAVLLPAYADAPAVPWVAGGLGLAAIGAGSYLSATGEACSKRQCPSGSPDSLLGPMVLVQSIPLLSVPVTYAIRALTAPDSNLEFAANPTQGGATARLSGRF